MSFFKRLGNNDANDELDGIDMFPDEYTVQKHIANAWAGDPLAQAKSVEYLALLAAQERFQTQLISHGALEPLLSLIRSTQTNTTILRNCAQAVACLAEHPNNHLRIDEEGGLDKLLQLITVSEADDQASQLRLPAITGICNLLDNDDLKHKVVSGGGIPYMLQLIQPSSSCLPVQQKAAHALSKVTAIPALLGKVVKHGLMKKLAITLSSEDGTMRLWGSCTANNVLSKENWVGKFVQDECLAPLMNIISEVAVPEGDTQTQLYACEALSRLASVRMYQARIREAGMISPLVSLTMKAENLPVQGAALKAMSNLLGTSENDTTALEALEVDLLVLLISAGPTEFVARTAAALANLADDEEKQEEIMEAGGLEHLIDLASRSNRLGTKMINLAKEHATRALANLALNNLAIDEMEQKGGVEPIMELVGHKDLQLVMEAVRGLANMTYEHITVRRRIMNATDVLTKLIGFTGSTDPALADLKRSACAAVQNLSEDTEHVQALSDAGALQHFINNTDSDDPDVQTAAISSLYNLMMSIGLQPLLSEVRLHSDEFELRAAQALMQLCFNDQTRFQIVKQGGLRLLYTLSESANVEDQRSLGKNMTALSENDSNKIRMVLEGGLKALQPLSLSADSEVVLEASMTLRNLCHKEQLKSTIVRGDGLVLCTNFAGSEIPEVHLYAAQAFSFLSTRPDVQFAVMQNQKALHALFSLTNSADREVQEYAVGAIANVSDNKDCHRALAEGGTLRQLIKLTRSRNMECQKKAAFAIKNVAVVPENREHVANEQGVEPLISMTRVLDAPEVQVHGALALSELALNEDNAIDIVKRGGLIPIVEMASSTDSKVQSAGVQCLANLARFQHNKLSIAERGGMDPLMRMARDPKGSELRAAAAMAVGYLSAQNEELYVLADEVNKTKTALSTSTEQIGKLEDELDTSEADKYALAGEIDKLRNKLFDVMRQSAIRKMKGIVNDWRRRMKKVAFDMFIAAVDAAVHNRDKELLKGENADLLERLEEQKASWAEYVNSNTNQVDEVYKQQAALKISSVMKQVVAKRFCACFFSWRSLCVDKKYFANATSQGQNKTLFAEVAKLKSRRVDVTDPRQLASIDQQISTIEKMIAKDTTIHSTEEHEGLQNELHDSKARAVQQELETEMIKDKLKRQACTQVMKTMKQIFQSRGPPGYFAHWRGVWLQRKMKVNMDGEDRSGGFLSAATSDQHMRKISKLQWLVREMKGERDDMWSEMNGLMATLRQFEKEREQLLGQLHMLQEQHTKVAEDVMVARKECTALSVKVDQTVEGK